MITASGPKPCPVISGCQVSIHSAPTPRWPCGSSNHHPSTSKHSGLHRLVLRQVFCFWGRFLVTLAGAFQCFKHGVQFPASLVLWPCSIIPKCLACVGPVDSSAFHHHRHWCDYSPVLYISLAGGITREIIAVKMKSLSRMDREGTGPGSLAQWERPKGFWILPKQIQLANLVKRY